MDLIPFSYQEPVSSKILPLTLMVLDDWKLINITGQDSEKYLQSQLTADITQINENQHLLAAHCNSRGKVWGTLRVFRRNKEFSIIVRCSVDAIQIREMQRYAVFSKVQFNHDDTFALLGIAGFQAREILKDFFSELPNANKPLINNGLNSILWFKYPSERFLIIIKKTEISSIIRRLRGIAQFSNSQQWLALHIESGIPIIDSPNSGLFIPQEINLQVLGGISFKKGCYIGQEMVARAEFRGVNKYVLWCLLGITKRVPKVGEDLEVKIGQNWRRTGTILAAVRLTNNRLLVQSIMKNDLNLDNVFRLRDDDMHTLKIKSLPYF